MKQRDKNSDLKDFILFNDQSSSSYIYSEKKEMEISYMGKKTRGE